LLAPDHICVMEATALLRFITQQERREYCCAIYYQITVLAID